MQVSPFRERKPDAFVTGISAVKVSNPALYPSSLSDLEVVTFGSATNARSTQRQLV